MQGILEGWTHVPPLDGTELGESDLHEPSLPIEEEVAENLGCKWRVLHPFELPGVRRRRSYAPIYSPTTHSQHPRTPPPPAPSEDRPFTNWSSIGSRSPPVIPPPQSVPIGNTLTAPGIESTHETDQTTLQPSQPISQESYMGATSGVVQEDLPTTSKDC